MSEEKRIPDSFGAEPLRTIQNADRRYIIEIIGQPTDKIEDLSAQLLIKLLAPYIKEAGIFIQEDGLFPVAENQISYLRFRNSELYMFYRIAQTEKGLKNE